MEMRMARLSVCAPHRRKSWRGGRFLRGSDNLTSLLLITNPTIIPFPSSVHFHQDLFWQRHASRSYCMHITCNESMLESPSDSSSTPILRTAISAPAACR